VTKKEDGQPLMIFTLPDVCKATLLHHDTILSLVARGLFPRPIHSRPPIWSEDVIEAWVTTTARVARARPSVTVRQRKVASRR
jgi:predicted DNA-binding transcriptional regulator AlpA